MKNCKVIGVDLAKNSFYLFGLNHQGKPIGRKKFSRTQFSHFSPSKCRRWLPWKRVPQRTIGGEKFES